MPSRPFQAQKQAASPEVQGSEEPGDWVGVGVGDGVEVAVGVGVGVGVGV